MIRNVLIVDTETTGLDETAELIELGLVLYSAEFKTSIQEFSTLIPASSNPIEKINHIPEAALQNINPGVLEAGRGVVGRMCEAADVLTSYNTEFDRRFFPRKDKQWFCSMSDVLWPKASKPGLNLVALALEYGIGVRTVHRALADCRLLAELFNRTEDLQELLRVAMRPSAVFVAQVTIAQKDMAKEAGFKWQPDKRIWVRRMAVDDAGLLPFGVSVLG